MRFELIAKRLSRIALEPQKQIDISAPVAPSKKPAERVDYIKDKNTIHFDVGVSAAKALTAIKTVIKNHADEIKLVELFNLPPGEGLLHGRTGFLIQLSSGNTFPIPFVAPKGKKSQEAQEAEKDLRAAGAKFDVQNIDKTKWDEFFNIQKVKSKTEYLDKQLRNMEKEKDPDKKREKHDKIIDQVVWSSLADRLIKISHDEMEERAKRRMDIIADLVL